MRLNTLEPNYRWANLLDFDPRNLNKLEMNRLYIDPLWLTHSDMDDLTTIWKGTLCEKLSPMKFPLPQKFLNSKIKFKNEFEVISFFFPGKNNMLTPLCYVNRETGIDKVGCVSVRTTKKYREQCGNDKTKYYLFLANVITEYKDRLISSDQVEEFLNGTLCCMLRYRINLT